MPSAAQSLRPHPRLSRAFLAGVRVVFVTFLATLLAFSIGLLFGIVGVVLVKLIGGTATLSLTTAYSHVALPLALVATVVTFVLVLRSELRQYKNMSALQRLSAPRTRVL